MPIETRASRRFRERNDDSFKKIGGLVYGIQRRNCAHCDAEFVELMELYDAVTETETYRRITETLACAELYVITKCAELLGAWDVFNSVTVSGNHLYAILDVARYDAHWREICLALEMTFIHSKKQVA